MMDWTDRHCRYLLRLISRHTWLYTEMITSGAILHGDAGYLLAFDASEHPVALQLGGSDPDALAECARIGAQAGYDEINLNVGCPSDRVSSGRFGACLMAEPERVADCIAAMSAAVQVPVTVKTRIGIDHRDRYADLCGFIETVHAGGCNMFIVHARKAWLQGLSPKQNREVPPLDYAMVARLKQDYPQLTIVVNGGIQDLDSVEQHLQTFDGVMLGRSAYHDPWLLAPVDRRFYAADGLLESRSELVLAMLPYIQKELQAGTALKHITRHMLGLFHGMPGARHWRRHLGEHACRDGAGEQVVLDALERLQSVTGKHGSGAQQAHG